jgi:hypothetical protein
MKLLALLANKCHDFKWSLGSISVIYKAIANSSSSTITRNLNLVGSIERMSSGATVTRENKPSSILLADGEDLTKKSIIHIYGDENIKLWKRWGDGAVRFMI